MAAVKKAIEVTINLEAGNASLPDLGKTLGPTGVNIGEVKRGYDQATASQRGDVAPPRRSSARWRNASCPT
jgi:large subunit ribosomal protein L11